MTEQVLHVTVGEPIKSALDRAAGVMDSLQQGQEPTPYFGVGFAEIGQALAVFTPRRWELIAALREGGPMTIKELASYLRRDGQEILDDTEVLGQWLAIKKDQQGRVYTPYSEIILDVRLPQKRAA